jgi:hypothetical protein
MRIYLPLTLPLLRCARAGQAFGAQVQAHAVTPAVREWYVEGDLEELEYSALIDAAESSLRLLARDPTAPRRRVVVAAEVPDGTAVPGGAERSSVQLGVPVAFEHVVSVHVDAEDASAAIGQAIAALPAADAGDDDARFVLDGAEAHDLLWYDITELGDLLQ